MKTELEPTGERMIEDSYKNSLGAYVIYILHCASYKFAVEYCQSKRVLDLGCGSGYGSSTIAEYAAQVEAVDVSEEAVAYASEHYPKDNLHFSTIDPDAKLPFKNEEFDTIISFQVIEHVPDHDHYLQEAFRVLKPGGTLLIITPDRKNRLFPYQKPWNRWHLREYDTKSLSKLVSNYFKIEKALEMGARKDIAVVELRRYLKMKWATILFTLPVFPEFFRKNILNFIHTLKKLKSNEQPNKNEEYDFGTEVVNFKTTNKDSLNIVIVARK